jgi:hypothetical protein
MYSMKSGQSTCIFSKHKNDFRNLLIGSKQQWEYAFQQISTTIAMNTNKTAYLLKVYENPRYYAGWWLKTHEGHLNLQGSVPAEQNHSSIKAHLGNGAMSWSVADHARRLMKRQSRLTTKRRIKEAKHFHNVRFYQSSALGQSKVDEGEEAKTKILGWPYIKLYTVDAQIASLWQVYQKPDGASFLSLKVPGDDGQDKGFWLLPNQRCTCCRRLAYLHQCFHEIVRSGRFDITLYDQRWMMPSIYEEGLGTLPILTPHLHVTSNPPPTMYPDQGQDRCIP